MNGSFYRAYEDCHRGSRELIKSRLRAYADFIAPLAALQQRPAALDLGCGRGEWLELLGEAGFAACGVDLDEGMLAACRERALNVEQADAVASLRALPDASVALVSAFHLVEHMPFAELQTMIREALRVLQPGGLLIMETPNPENLVVGASSFYMDPSHLRPVPPPLLGFVVDYSGFMRHRVVRLQESVQLHTAAPIGLINVLNGVSPDYAVVAQKSANAAVLSAFDRPFGIGYGISLEALAQRYDLQTETRVSKINNSLAQIEADAAQNLQQLDRRMEQMDDRLAQAERQLHAVFFSRSWRITASLRFVAREVRQLRSGVREARMVSQSKKCIKALLRKSGLAMLRQPYLRKAALSVLERMPGLRHRLHGIVRQQANAPDAKLTEIEPKYLSPRAQSIYTELTKMIDGKKI
jgi:hypothetical protein